MFWNTGINWIYNTTIQIHIMWYMIILAMKSCTRHHPCGYVMVEYLWSKKAWYLFYQTNSRVRDNSVYPYMWKVGLWYLDRKSIKPRQNVWPDVDSWITTCQRPLTTCPRQQSATEQQCVHSVDHSPPGQNNRLFADNISRCMFLNVKLSILNKISLKLFPKVPIHNNQAQI